MFKVEVTCGSDPIAQAALNRFCDRHTTSGPKACPSSRPTAPTPSAGSCGSWPPRNLEPSSPVS